MLQIAIDIVGPPPAPPRTAPVSTPAGGFDLMMEQLRVADPDAEAPPIPIPPLPLPGSALPPERQDLAGEEADEAELPQGMAHEDEELAEPIWLPPMIAPDTPRLLPKLVMNAATRPVSTDPTPMVATQIAVEPNAEQIDQPPAVDPNLIAPEPEVEPIPREKAPPAELRLPETKAYAPPLVFQPAAIALQPVAQIAFAAQRVEQSAQPAIEEPARTAEPGPASIAAPSPSPARVEASSNAQDAPLDMSRDDWIESMIERIDALRENGERGAQIRLRPDALGAVDVRIRHEGEQVHISFAAENPAARSLLAEAAPRLAELAEARGLKLGDTGVGQGFGGERRDASQLADPRAPNRAPSTEASTQTPRSNERIA